MSEPDAAATVATEYPDTLVECWTWPLGIEVDMPTVLRDLADRLHDTGWTLLSLIVTTDELVQAFVDTERGLAPRKQAGSDV